MENQLSWAASEPNPVNLPVERRSGISDYFARIEELLALGEGYSEVSCNDQTYPRVSFSFRGAYGVVEHWASAEEIYLLIGDGSIADTESILIPGEDGDTEYTGAFISSRQCAWGVVKNFIRSGSVNNIGKWERL